MHPIRVLIADDHPVVLTGLQTLLARDPDVEVVAQARDGQEAVRKALDLRPDVLILDISMPKMNGIQALQQIRRSLPEVRALVLSMYRSNEMVRSALRAGASGYVLKDNELENLTDVVQAVHRGEPYLSPSIARVVIEVLQSEQQPPPLSERELEVLQQIADGRSSKEIAPLLGISPRTVDTHRQNVMDKLGIHSLAGLVKYAIRIGLSDIE